MKNTDNWQSLRSGGVSQAQLPAEIQKAIKKRKTPELVKSSSKKPSKSKQKLVDAPLPNLQMEKKTLKPSLEKTTSVYAAKGPKPQPSIQTSASASVYKSLVKRSTSNLSQGSANSNISSGSSAKGSQISTDSLKNPYLKGSRVKTNLKTENLKKISLNPSSGALTNNQSQTNSKSSLVNLDTLASSKQHPPRVITPTASSKPIQIIKIGSQTPASFLTTTVKAARKGVPSIFSVGGK